MKGGWVEALIFSSFFIINFSFYLFFLGKRKKRVFIYFTCASFSLLVIALKRGVGF
jgi:hypothetical protein